MKPKIVVVGSSNTDMVLHVKQFPSAGETVLGNQFMTVQGGKGANQAVAAARLGAEVIFVTRLGVDSFGKESHAAYQAEGIDTRYIIHDETVNSGVALILVNDQAENEIAVAPNANGRLTPKDVLAAEAAIKEAGCLLLQLEIPMDAVETAVDLARQYKVRVILNPAPYAPLSPVVLRNIDILTPNEAEVEMLAKQFSLTAAPRDLPDLLLKSKVGNLIITCGDKGVRVVEAQKVKEIPAYKVKAVDTTAAGDAFNGGLAFSLASGTTLDEAIQYANAVAAISATRSGAQSSLPKWEEVNTFLRQDK